MRRPEFTPRARRDIEEIWECSFDRFGLDRAEAYLRDIERAAATVAEDPRRESTPATKFAPAIASSPSGLMSCLPSLGDPRPHRPDSPWADEFRAASPLTPVARRCARGPAGDAALSSRASGGCRRASDRPMPIRLLASHVGNGASLASLACRAGAPAPLPCAWAMALATVAIVGMAPSCIIRPRSRAR